LTKGQAISVWENISEIIVDALENYTKSKISSVEDGSDAHNKVKKCY